MARRAGAEIFFLVESGVKPDYLASAGTVGDKADGTREAAQGAEMNMICVVTSRSAMRFMAVRGKVGATEVREFLKHLMHARRRPAYVIVEGLPSQRSKEVQAYVDSLEGRLRLFVLPSAVRSAGRR